MRIPGPSACCAAAAPAFRGGAGLAALAFSAATALFVSCVSPGAAGDVVTPPVTSAEAALGDAGTAPDGPGESRAAAARLRAYRVAADEALTDRHLVQGAASLAALVSEGRRYLASSPSDPDGLGELVATADADLRRMVASLSLEASDEWRYKGAMLDGVVEEAARGAGPMPAVTLLSSYSFGKAVVPDAHIRFEVVSGIALSPGSATTDEYGRAERPLAQVGGVPLIVRASLELLPGVVLEGMDLPSVEFRYHPANQSVLLALRPAGSLPAGAEGTLRGTASDALASLGLVSVPGDAPIAAVAAAELAVEARRRGASYAAELRAGLSEPRRMVYQGLAYDIYTVEASGSLALLSSAGELLFSLPVTATTGRGGTPAAAAAAALAAFSAALPQAAGAGRGAFEAAIAAPALHR